MKNWLGIIAGLFLLWGIVPLAAGSDHEGGKAGAAHVLEKSEFDVVYGDPKAPVVLTEYSSLNCPHCRDFHVNIIDKIMGSLIDSGKVFFVYRHFPINMPAVRAAMLVHCLGDEPQQKKFVTALFHRQSEWSSAENEEVFLAKLTKIAEAEGINNSSFASCADDEDLEGRMLLHQFEVRKELGIRYTPTIFINGEEYNGSLDPDAFTKALTGIVSDEAGQKVPVAPKGLDMDSQQP